MVRLTFYTKRIYCLEVKQPKDCALKRIKTGHWQEMSPQCSLARQEVKRKRVASWEKLDAKLLGFWGEVPSSEVTTFGEHAAKPGWFSREGGTLVVGFLPFPRTPLGSVLVGA